MNLRRIARQLGVHHQSVINWVNAHVSRLPEAPPLPSEVKVVEQDELFTFVGDKKNTVYVMTLMERQTNCIISWAVSAERTEPVMQALVDTAPQAEVYYSDAFSTYSALLYAPGRHIAMTNKS